MTNILTTALLNHFVFNPLLIVFHDCLIKWWMRGMARLANSQCTNSCREAGKQLRHFDRNAEWHQMPTLLQPGHPQHQVVYRVASPAVWARPSFAIGEFVHPG